MTIKLTQIRADGYKNLIDSVVDLGDFTVLVGPNNSGKSNLLEVLQILWPVCFGDEDVRTMILKGQTRPRWGTSICHLEAHKGKQMTIGISFEAVAAGEQWKVDYDVKLQCDSKDGDKRGFISETLSGKIPTKPGPAKTYIARTDKEVKVCDEKAHPIGKDNPSLLALRTLYPEFKDLPEELRVFVEAIEKIGRLKVFAASPRRLRDEFGSETQIRGLVVSSFDLGLVVDRLHQDEKHFELFKEALCDVLGLEELYFAAQDYVAPTEKAESAGKKRRVRFLVLRQRGSEPSFIDEYSDGTFAAASIIAGALSEESRGPVLCIEEPENFLHPAALKKLLRFLQDNAHRWQVLMTTHSPYLLNGVNPQDVRVAVVNETGGTQFEKVENTRQLRDNLNKGLMSFGDLLASNFEEVLERKQ